METEKQTNYYVVNQFQANVLFLHPLKTAETLLFFRCVLGVKKGNCGLKLVDNSGRKIISIRNNVTSKQRYKWTKYNFNKCQQ